MNKNDSLISASANKNLQRLVQLALELDKVSCSSASDYESKISSAISQLEELTIQVSQLDIFSNNESIDELSTLELRFLLLPALLAFFTEKLTKSDRRSNLDRVEIYIKDFVSRLNDYEILPKDSAYTFLITKDDEDDEADCPKPETSSGVSFQATANTREAKIKRFREHDDCKRKYEELAKSLPNVNDDDNLREYYLVELNYWARKLYDLLEYLRREKQMLDHMSKVKGGEIQPEPMPKRPPTKPFVLLQNKLQKQIFGLGYPSIPTMTIEEFYENKIKEGQIQPVSQKPMTEEEEEIAKEYAKEKDDVELIESERRYDEYKDHHRRGWGNTKNMG